MPHIRFSDQDPEQVRRRLAQIEEGERFRTRVYWRAIAAIVAITVAGAALLVGGLTSHDAVVGPALFWSGVLGADLGIVSVLAWAYLQLEE